MSRIKIHLTLMLVLTMVFGIPARSAPKKSLTNEEKRRQKIVSGNTAFALDLYQYLKVVQKDKNLFFSPYSISTALAMTYAGARGDTARQMAGVLHFDLPPDELHPSFGQLQKYFNISQEQRSYQLLVANALWGQQDYDFLPSFLNLIQTCYEAGLHEVDFIHQTEISRQIINRWVEEKTREKIKELIKKGVLKPLTRLVLTNAIYFKGNWAEQFDKELTRPAPFYVNVEKEVKADLMYKKDTLGYAQREGLQIVALPYQGGQLSMVVLLPNEKDGLVELEKQLNVRTVTDWLEQLPRRKIKVFLPKFRMTSGFGLADILRRMGMKDAFSPAADFSGMNSRRDLFISAVIHKAFVEVNEEGTEAAGATGVVMELTSALPAPVPVFRADHPFLFLIRDNRTGSILFLGRVIKPSDA